MTGLRRICDLWWDVDLWLFRMDQPNLLALWSVTPAFVLAGIGTLVVVYGNTTLLAWLLAAVLVAMTAGELEAR